MPGTLQLVYSNSSLDEGRAKFKNFDFYNYINFYYSGAAKKNAATYVMSERPSSWSKIVGKGLGDEIKCRFWPISDQ